MKWLIISLVILSGCSSKELQSRCKYVLSSPNLEDYVNDRDSLPIIIFNIKCDIGVIYDIYKTDINVTDNNASN